MGKKNFSSSQNKSDRRNQSSEGLSSSHPAKTAVVDQLLTFPSHLLLEDNYYDGKKKNDVIQKKKNSCRGRRRMEALVPGYVWIVPNFFSDQECQNWIRYMDDESKSWEYTMQRGTRYLAARECYRTQRNDPEIAQIIFRRLQDCSWDDSSIELQHAPPNDDDDNGLPPSDPVGCNPNVRLYKYTKGHIFGKHIDESVPIGQGYQTQLTALVYLSECHGGATRFQLPPNNDANPPTQRNKRPHEEEVAFQPQVGTLLLHLHGDNCLLHQADPVLGGIKYVLRTDVVYKI